MERVHIYDDPPPRAVLEKIAGTLPGGVGELISTRGRKYKELGLAGQRLSDDEWYRLIEKEPRLLRRPILWDGQRAVVGFRQATYRDLFGPVE